MKSEKKNIQSVTNSSKDKFSEQSKSIDRFFCVFGENVSQNIYLLNGYRVANQSCSRLTGSDHTALKKKKTTLYAKG